MNELRPPRPFLVSNTTDLRAVVGSQMLLLHALRKRRKRMLERRPSRSVHLVQNALLLRRVQRRQSRIHFLVNLVKTAVTAGLGRELCPDKSPSTNHVSVHNDEDEDMEDEDADDDDQLLSPGQISDDVWLNTFRVGKDLYQYLLTELKPFMSLNEADQGDKYPPFEQRVSIALWRLGKVWDDPSLMRAFGVMGDTVSAIVREFCAAIVKVLMPRFVQVPYDEDLEDIEDQFRRRTGLPRCAGALCFAHVPIQPPAEDVSAASDYINPEGWSSVVVQAVVGADRRFWDLNIGWPGSTQVAQVLRSSSLWKKGEDGTLLAQGSQDVCGTQVRQVLAAGAGYPLRRWIVTPFLKPDERQQRFNRSVCEVLSVGESAFRRLEARFPFLLRHNGSGIDLMPSIVAACTTLHNMCEEWGDGFADFWLAEASRHALPQPHPGSDPVGDSAKSPDAEAVRAALFAAVLA